MGDERRGNLTRWTDGPPGFVDPANRQLDELDRRTSPGAPPPSNGGPTGQSREVFPAVLTDEPSPGVFSWKKLIHDTDNPGEHKDDPNDITGTENAYETSIGAKKLPTRASTSGGSGEGQLVYLKKIGVNASGQPIYGFNLYFEDASDPKQIGPTLGTDEEQTTAFADSWKRGDDAKGVQIEEFVRQAYDHNETDPKLYAFYRIWEFDATGALVRIDTETRQIVDDTESCPA